MFEFPSLIFLIFNILGIILGNFTLNYVKCLVIELLILICIILLRYKNIAIYFVAILFSIYGSFVTIYTKNSSDFLEYKGKNIRIHGNIVSERTKKDDKYYYVVETKRIQFKKDKKEIEKKILLVTDKDLCDCSCYGREICFIGEVRKPTKNRNVRGFNYKTYLDGRNIVGTVFAKGDLINVGDKTRSNKLIEVGYILKQKIFNTMDKLFDKNESALLKGMLVGNAQDISKDMVNKFREIGLAHMFSVSGSNVVYLVLIVKSICKLAKLKHKWVASIVIVVLSLYVLIVGFNQSLIRVTVMTILTFMGQVLFYNSNTISNWVIAALIITMINPLAIFSMSFQFSFIATLFIVLFAQKIGERLSGFGINEMLSDLLSVSVAVNIGIVPLKVYYFNKVSLGEFIINILLSYVNSMLIFVGMITVMIGSVSCILAKPLVGFIKILIRFIYIVVEHIPPKGWLNIDAIYIGCVGVIVYYAVVVCIYAYNKNDKVKTFFAKYKNIIVAACTAVVVVCMVLPDNFRVNFMDVGQGDCTLIKTSCNKNILIDGGEKINISDIINNRVTKIDVMVATHGHMDHIGGLIDIVSSMNVKKLIIPDTKYMGYMNELLDKIDTRKTTVYRCKSNDSILVDKHTRIEFLNPSVSDELKGENDNSLVCKVYHKDKSFLFTADISDECEDKMLRDGVNLEADVLKVAHHGSEYSTSENFIRKVKPKFAIISVGEHNKFDHPSGDVLERLRNNNVAILRTDEGGQITMTTRGKKMCVRTNI